MSDTVDPALQSVLKLFAAMSANSYSRLVTAGVLSREQAADALREDADFLETMHLPTPLVGQLVAEDMRGFAEAFERKEGPLPKLSLLTGGKGADDEPGGPTPG
jgi:hypothetical protein